MSSRLLRFNKSCYCAIICRCIAVYYTGFRSNTMQSAVPLFQFSLLVCQMSICLTLMTRYKFNRSSNCQRCAVDCGFYF